MVMMEVDCWTTLVYDKRHPILEIEDDVLTTISMDDCLILMSSATVIRMSKNSPKRYELLIRVVR